MTLHASLDELPTSPKIHPPTNGDKARCRQIHPPPSPARIANDPDVDRSTRHLARRLWLLEKLWNTREYLARDKPWPDPQTILAAGAISF